MNDQSASEYLAALDRQFTATVHVPGRLPGPFRWYATLGHGVSITEFGAHAWSKNQLRRRVLRWAARSARSHRLESYTVTFELFPTREIAEVVDIRA